MNAKLVSVFVAVFIIVFAAGSLTACAGSTASKDAHIDYWTCSMHPQIHKDEKGQCPICGMDLVPVMKKEAKPAPAPAAGKEASPPTSSSVTITPEQQKQIGVKTVAVSSQSLTQEIHVSGRVAYDPELAVAIREYQETIKNAPFLKTAAASRLKLMGLSDSDIAALTSPKKGEAALPGKKDITWVYATLFTNDAEGLVSGSTVKIDLPDGSRTFTGTLRSLTPVVDAATRTLTARIELEPNAGLRPDTFVNVSLTKDLGTHLAIPKSAMVNTGMKKLAFKVHDGDQFTPVQILTGAETEDKIIVTGGLSEGDVIVAAATFFVDSETQLKGATDVAATPECPKGQTWDAGMAMCM